MRKLCSPPHQRWLSSFLRHINLWKLGPKSNISEWKTTNKNPTHAPDATYRKNVSTAVRCYVCDLRPRREMANWETIDCIITANFGAVTAFSPIVRQRFPPFDEKLEMGRIKCIFFFERLARRLRTRRRAFNHSSRYHSVVVVAGFLRLTFPCNATTIAAVSVAASPNSTAWSVVPPLIALVEDAMRGRSRRLSSAAATRRRRRELDASYCRLPDAWYAFVGSTAFRQI